MTNSKLKNLTKTQLETFNSLVRLGDTKELALKTVLNLSEISNEAKEFYRFAYTN